MLFRGEKEKRSEGEGKKEERGEKKGEKEEENATQLVSTILQLHQEGKKSSVKLRKLSKSGLWSWLC